MIITSLTTKRQKNYCSKLIFKSGFFKKKRKTEKRHYSETEKIEISDFYKMLVKMKRRRPNFDIERIINKLYPNHNIEFRE